MGNNQSKCYEKPNYFKYKNPVWTIPEIELFTNLDKFPYKLSGFNSLYYNVLHLNKINSKLVRIKDILATLQSYNRPSITIHKQDIDKISFDKLDLLSEDNYELARIDGALNATSKHYLKLTNKKLNCYGSLADPYLAYFNARVEYLEQFLSEYRLIKDNITHLKTRSQEQKIKILKLLFGAKPTGGPKDKRIRRSRSEVEVPLIKTADEEEQLVLPIDIDQNFFEELMKVWDRCYPDEYLAIGILPELEEKDWEKSLRVISEYFSQSDSQIDEMIPKPKPNISEGQICRHFRSLIFEGIELPLQQGQPNPAQTNLLSAAQMVNRLRENVPNSNSNIKTPKHISSQVFEAGNEILTRMKSRRNFRISNSNPRRIDLSPWKVMQICLKQLSKDNAKLLRRKNPKVSASVRILSLFQKYLFAEASAVDSSERHRNINKVLQYVCQLIPNCVSLLKGVNNLLNLKCDEEEVFKLLDCSCVRNLLPLALHSVTIVINHLKGIDVINNKVMRDLTETMKKLYKEIQQLFQNTKRRERIDNSFCGFETVESLNLINQNSNYEVTVTIPGATHLSVNFALPVNRLVFNDILRITTGEDSKEVRINLNDSCCLVKGNTVTFKINGENKTKLESLNYRHDIKAVVLGQKFELRDEDWLEDIFKTLSVTMSSLCSAMVRGLKVRTKEIECKWIHSPFFRNAPLNTSLKCLNDISLEKKIFLEEFLSDRENSITRKLNAFMFESCNRIAIDSIKDIHLTETTNYFIAMCIKQLQLEDIAGDLANQISIPNYKKERIEIKPILKDIWKCAKELKQHIISEKHLVLSKEELNAEQRKNVVERICKPILDKTKFLLCFSAIKGDDPIAYSIEKSFVETVFAFLRDPITIEEYRSICKRRYYRAISRTQAFKIMTKSVTSLSEVKDTSIICALVNTFTAGCLIGHYSTNTLGAGEKTVQQVKESCFEMISVALRIIENQLGNNDVSTVQLITCLVMEFNIEDIEDFLKTRLMDTLINLKNKSRNPLCRELAGDLYSHYAVMWSKMNIIVKENAGTVFLNTSKMKKFVKLYVESQTKLYSTACREIEKWREALESLKSKAELCMASNKAFVVNENGKSVGVVDCLPLLNNPKTDLFKWFEAEQKLYDTLVIFSSNSGEMSFYQGVTPAIILSLVNSGSPRIERLSTRILRTYLARQTFRNWGTNRKEFCGTKGDSFELELTPFFKQVFLQIGGLFLDPGVKRPPFDGQSLCSYSGMSHQAKATELMFLVRYMARHDCFKKIICEYVRKCLVKLLDCVDFDGQCVLETADLSDIRLAMAALAVIGGYPNIFRKGGRVVDMKTNREECDSDLSTLFQINRSAGTCKVISDNDPIRSVTKELNKIVPIAECSIPKPLLEMAGSIFPILEKFVKLVSSTINSNSELEFDYKLQPKSPGKAEQKEKQRRKWSCSMCTFLNEASKNMCEMCNSPLPEEEKKKLEIKSKKTPKKRAESHESPFKQNDTQITPEKYVFSQIKSFVMKAFCEMLLQEEKLYDNAEEHYRKQENHLEMLIRTAVSPTNLKEFFGLETLESALTRLQEKIYEKLNAFKSPWKSYSDEGLDKILPFSPFRFMQVDLPTCINIETSSNCTFNLENGLQNCISSDKTNVSSVCWFKTNRTIPKLIKAYYFEVTVGAGAISEGFGMAIGLSREGCQFEAIPGENTSYAFLHNGSTRHSKDHKENPGHSWERKSSSNQSRVGCGFDVVGRKVYFTLNGEILKNQIDNVSGNFFPSFWTDIPNLNVRINVGQEPFAFAFEKTLSEDYLKQLESESKSPQLNRKQLERRRKAEGLMEIMGQFPVELCVVALEQEEDDVQRAAEWLLEKGWAELDRMGNALMASQEAVAADNSDESEESEWREIANLQVEQNNNPARNYLNDNLENLEDLRRHASTLIINLSANRSRTFHHFPSHNLGRKGLSDGLNVEIGQKLGIASNASRISPELFGGNALFLQEKTGVVRAVDSSAKTVFLEVIDDERGVNVLLKLPYHCLKEQKSSWEDTLPLSKGGENGLPAMFSEYEKLSNAVSVLRVRHAVLKIIGNLPQDKPLNLTKLGGKNLFLKYIKLISAEKLSFTESSEEESQSKGSKAMAQIKRRLESILLDEISKEETDPDPLISKGIFEKPEEIKNAVNALKERSERLSMRLLLAEECAVHFVQAAHNPIPKLTYRSPGSSPYKPHVKKSGCIHIPGARSLAIYFHPNCRLSGDILTSLRFYKNSEKTDLIYSFRDKEFEKLQSSPIVVRSNRCYYNFQSSGDTNYWGYRFTVKPIDLRIDDYQAINCQNLQLGCWILDMLLSNGMDNMKRSQIKQLFDAVSWYVLKAKIGSKCRGVHLLNRIMLNFQKLPSESIPSYEEIYPLQKELSVTLNRMFDYNTQKFPSPLVQSFVELIAVIDVVKTVSKLKGDILPSPIVPEETTANEPLHSKDILRIGRHDLEVVDAKLIVENEGKNTGRKHINVTPAVKAHLKNYDGAFLIIPPKMFWGKILPMDLPNLKERKDNTKLAIRYRLTVTRLSKDNLLERFILDEVEKTFSNPKEIALQAQPRAIDLVKEISMLTLSINSDKGEYQHHTQLEAKKVQCVSNNHFLIAARLEIDPERKGITVQSPLSNSGYQIDTFSVMFWIRVEGDQKEEKIPILCKGMDRLGSSLFPLIVLKKNGSLVVEVDSVSGRLIIGTVESLVTPGKWTHVAVNCDSDKVFVVVNGKTVTETPGGVKFTANNDPFFIGRIPHGALLHDFPSHQRRFSLRDVRYYSDYLPGDLVPGVIEETNPLNETQTNEFKPSLNALVESLQKPVKFTAEMDTEVLRLAIHSLEPLREEKSSSETSSHVGSRRRSSSRHVTFADPVAVEQRPIRTDQRERLEQLDIFRREIDTEARISLRNLVQISHNWTMNDILPQFNEEDDEEISEMEAFEEDEDEENFYPSQFAGLPIFSGEELAQLDAQEISRNASEIDLFPAIAHLPIDEIRERFVLIKMFNGKLSKVIKMVEFSQVRHEWSLAYRIASLRHILFYSTKCDFFATLLRKTTTLSRPQITVSRPKAAKAKETGDPDGRKSVFGQIFRQLNEIPPSLLRNNGRTWTITYAGEGGQDAGGLFRDSISALCQDVQEGHVPLLVKCPNGRTSSGDNQEKLVPAPCTQGGATLEMFNFLGKLMGIAIRSHSVLALDISNVVWKPLVGIPITRGDIEEIDLGFNEHIKSLERPELHATEETFSDVFPLTFTANRSDGTAVELRPGGKGQNVSFEESEKYSRMVLDFRLKEFDSQVEAIREGLGCIVPGNVLTLFTACELEYIVCGRREIDIDFLKANTQYRNGTKSKDPHVVWLWEILREFSHEDRQKFLRFVWGQSRLPLTNEDFGEKFTVSTNPRGGDESLPTSHTCFFSLHLPAYSEKEMLKKKLLYAIHNCTAIDTDFMPNNSEWGDE